MVWVRMIHLFNFYALDKWFSEFLVGDLFSMINEEATTSLTVHLYFYVHTFQCNMFHFLSIEQIRKLREYIKAFCF